jgi:glycosyltransferase involved in cell wall biosynthesis
VSSRSATVPTGSGSTRLNGRVAPARMLIVVNEHAVDGHAVLLRRALAFRALLADEFHINLIVAPDLPHLSDVRDADLLYVIDPGRTGFPSALIGWMLRRPVVVEMGDPQAALYRAQGRSSLSVSAGGAIDWIVARRAKGIVVRGRGLARVLALRVPWVEIPDGVDVDRFVPGADGGLREELGIPSGALVAGLAGSLRQGKLPSATYGWDLVEALSLLRDEPVWALVVGGGNGLEPLKRLAQESGVGDRLITPGFVSHDEVPRYIAAMDVCLSRQTDDDVGWSRTTAKLPEYLACDRHVLATAVGAASEVLPDEMLLPYEGSYDSGHVVRLAERLAALVPRQGELRRSAGTRRIALERYSYPALARSLSSFLHEVAA